MVEPTLGAALDRIETIESTPPLWYLLAWTLEKTGAPVEAARGIGVVSGALLAGLLVVYSRRFLPLAAAGLAGLLAALATQLVARGSELRAYALYALLALVFAWLLERAARAPTGGRLVALAVATAAGLLTHYFFALVAIVGLVWLWTTPEARSARRRASAAVGLGVLPLLLWAPSAWTQASNQRFSWISDFSVVKAASVYSAYVWNPGPLFVRDLVQIGFWEGLARVFALVLVAAGCVVLWRLGASGRLAALLAVGPVLLGAALWLAAVDLFTTRNVLAAAPFAAVAVAVLLAALPRAAALVGAAAALAVVAVGLAREASPPPYDEVAEALVELGWQPGDQVAILGGAHELDYYGSAYAVRGPVSWYLPGHPTLVPWSGEPCAQAFAVVRSGAGDSLVEGAEATRTPDDLVVARIPCSDDLAERAGALGAFLFVPSR
jgi:mannosyltransferase